MQTPVPEQRRAVALVSGGLDSMLAVRLIQEQGIEVEGLNFFTGLCVEGHTHAIKNRDRSRGDQNYDLDDIMLLKVGRHLRPKPLSPEAMPGNWYI